MAGVALRGCSFRICRGVLFGGNQGERPLFIGENRGSSGGAGKISPGKETGKACFQKRRAFAGRNVSMKSFLSDKELRLDDSAREPAQFDSSGVYGKRFRRRIRRGYRADSLASFEGAETVPVEKAVCCSAAARAAAVSGCVVIGGG